MQMLNVKSLGKRKKKSKSKCLLSSPTILNSKDIHMSSLLFFGISNMVSYHPHRLQNALSQKMDASGYREKAPQNVQEEDMRKLTALMEQLEVISEAEKKLDAKASST